MKHTVLFIIVVFFISCDLFEKESKPKEIYGCMDSTAINYNPDATIDDGSCGYCREGSSFLLMSKDGGITWEYNCTNVYDISWSFQITVIDTEHIWVACSNPEGVSNTEAILFSADKGKTWEKQFSFLKEGGAAGIDQLIFTDAYNGLIVVDERDVGPQFYKTTDGGHNWTKVQTPPTEGSLRNHERVDFVDHNSAYFINTSTLPRKFYGTSDLGAPWDTTHFSDALHVEFFDKNIGLIVGHYNSYRTNDGGKTWEKNPLDFLNANDDLYWGHGIRFSNIDPKDVWLLDNQNINFSSDTGRTWQNFPINIRTPDMYVYNTKAWITPYSYSHDARTGQWSELKLPTPPYPIIIWPETVGGYKDEIIVMTGSF